jgi:RHS repeat-associated protein
MFRLRTQQINALCSTRSTLPDRFHAGLEARGLAAERVAVDTVRMTDSRGFVTTQRFTTDGAPAATILPSGRRIEYSAVSNAPFAQITVPGGEQVRLGFDARGNLASIGRAGSTPYMFTHDAQDRIVEAKYPDGTATRWQHGPKGLEALTDRTGATTRFDSDAGRIVDPNGRSTRLTTGPRGRLEQIHLPDGRTQEYLYRAGGGLAAICRQDKSLLRIEQAASDETHLVWPDGRRTRLASGTNSRTARTDTASISTTYDARGNLATETSAAGAVVYTYDDDGRMTALSARGMVVHYRYDEDGRLSAIAWDGVESAFSYDALGAISSIRHGHGITAEHRRVGPLGLPIKTAVMGPGGLPLSEQSYDHDVCDRLVEVIDRSAPGCRDVVHRRFSYDAEGRLLSERDITSGRNLAEYAYDVKGGMIRDCGREVRLGAMDEPTHHGGNAIVYDALGNAVSIPTRSGQPLTLRWNSDGTVAETTCESRRVQYKYDPLGRRIEKTEGQTCWTYGWAGPLLVWEELRRAPDQPAVRRDYVYTPDGIPFAFREFGETFHLQTDPRGAVVRVFDRHGKVVWNARYDSFGAATVVSGSIHQPLRLLGQYEDEETGLFYNVARYYCPWLKTYLSLDPNWLHLDATNYSFAKNSPWTRADPTGALAPLIIVGLVVLGGGLIGAGLSAVSEYFFGHGNILGAAVNGFITGVFTTAGALLGVFGGPPGVAAGAIIGGAIGSFFGTLVEGAINGEGWCWSCAARSALISVVLDLLTLGLSKIPIVKRLLEKLMKRLPDWWPRPPKPPLRIEYENAVKALKDMATELAAKGMTPEEIARAVSQARRDLGIKYKDLTPPELLEKLYERNMKKYGDKLGPTVEWLRAQGKSWEEIIESASRPDGSDIKFE